MTTARIDARFAALKAQGRAGFVTYVMAGDPTPEQAQAYQDAQGCVIVLKAAGGDDNLRMADLALAKASELAPINGDDTDAKFTKSMKDWEEILQMASPDEASQFLANCRETWSD